MYADYSTDAVSGYDDKERSKASSPPSGTAVSYPSRSTSFSPTNGTATYSPSLRSQPLHAGSQSQSPKDPLSLRAATPPSQPLSVSPYSGSPRPSDEIQLPPTQPQSHPPSQPHRRDSLVAPSVNSERIITQYAPTELGSVDEGPNAGFDESVLRALCDLDCGVPLLLDRIKQSMISCREVSLFFKKRAAVEDEYGRAMQKTARGAHEQYALNDGKAGTFVTAWQSTMKLHDVVAENRLKFAARLNEMSDELNNLAKEVEKNRKATKDLSTRYERALQESETTLEKAKARFESTHEELERVLLAKEGESAKDAGGHARNGGPSGKRVIGKAVAKGGMLLKGKNPNSLAKQEEDIRQRMSTSSDAFRKAVLDTQHMRQEYFNFQLPRILRSLKECADEIDMGTQYHLARYAYLFETTVLNDGATLVPTGGIEDGPGLKPIMESIDNRADFKAYMQNYAIAHNRPTGPRREGAWEDGFVQPLPRHHNPDPLSRIPNSDTKVSMSPSHGSHGSHDGLHNGANGTPPAGNYPPAIAAAMAQYADKGRPTFGVDLAEQMVRDGVEVPRIMEKCCEAIETYGSRSVGIYRLSGTTSKVQKLKLILDRDLEAVDLLSDEWKMDVNNVTSVLKLWLRELPEPLLTFNLYQGYIEAAKTDNERLRHIQLHHRVNDLPDANYATLKFLIGHLHRIREFEGVNSMSSSNLSIVFGPTLLGPPPPSMTGEGGGGGTTLQDMNWQCKAIETIIDHYNDIFVDEGESTAAAATAASPPP